MWVHSASLGLDINPHAPAAPCWPCICPPLHCTLPCRGPPRSRLYQSLVHREGQTQLLKAEDAPADHMHTALAYALHTTFACEYSRPCASFRTSLAHHFISSPLNPPAQGPRPLCGRAPCLPMWILARHWRGSPTTPRIGAQTRPCMGPCVGSHVQVCVQACRAPRADLCTSLV